MKQIGSCRSCQALVIAYTNAMQVCYEQIFSDLNLSARATPKATWKKYSGHCVYCGQETKWELRGSKKSKDAPELDHWIPISLGGPPTQWNMLLSCRTCNSSKGDSLRPYPQALLNEFPELTDRTIQATELAVGVWGKCAIECTHRVTYCELMAHIYKSWPGNTPTIAAKFPKLSQFIETWNPNLCSSITDTKYDRMASILERETAKVLYVLIRHNIVHLTRPLNTHTSCAGLATAWLTVYGGVRFQNRIHK